MVPIANAASAAMAKIFPLVKRESLGNTGGLPLAMSSWISLWIEFDWSPKTTPPPRNTAAKPKFHSTSRRFGCSAIETLSVVSVAATTSCSRV